MTRRRRIAVRLLAACCLFADSATAPAQELLFRHVADARTNTFVEVNAMFSKLPPTGSAPVRVTIANRTGRDQSVRLDFRSSDGFYGRGGSELRSSFPLTTAAGRTEEFDLMVPLTTALASPRGGMVSLGVEMNGSLGSAQGASSTAAHADQPAVLLSSSLFTHNASALDAEANTHYSGGARWKALTFAASFEPEMLPADWRGYGGYDTIVLTDTDWSAIPAAARGAILAWNRLGGRIIFYATGDSTTPAKLGIPDGPERSFGRIEIHPISNSLSLDAAETFRLVTNEADRQPRFESICNDTSRNWPLQNEFGTKAFNYLLFILVLVAFGVIVGPVNLFVFAKSGMRHRLFVTTPLISLGASALLVLLIIIQDGFGGRGFRVALAEVRGEGDEHAAYVHQEQISRTGVLLGGSFRIAESALITPAPLRPDRWARVTTSNGGGGARYTLQPTAEGADAAGDWFQSRSEQAQLIQAVIPTRGRIERLAEAGAPRVMSSFEFPVARLFLVDADGSFWTAGDLQPGKPATCTASDRKAFDDFVTAEKKRFTEANARRLERVTARRGHFVATAADGPLVDTYPPIRWKNNHLVLTGPVASP